jgi:hypothetical protein
MNKAMWEFFPFCSEIAGALHDFSIVKMRYVHRYVIGRNRIDSFEHTRVYVGANSRLHNPHSHLFRRNALWRVTRYLYPHLLLDIRILVDLPVFSSFG